MQFASVTFEQVGNPNNVNNVNIFDFIKFVLKLYHLDPVKVEHILQLIANKADDILNASDASLTDDTTSLVDGRYS